VGILELSAVSKRFGGQTVLDSISLEFAQGRVTAVVGASG
jgi:ABC-type transporter Mla maintaining outer membrane lipid asymmetry ATPase subunit MlaF